MLPEGWGAWMGRFGAQVRAVQGLRGRSPAAPPWMAGSYLNQPVQATHVPPAHGQPLHAAAPSRVQREALSAEAGDLPAAVESRGRDPVIRRLAARQGSIGRSRDHPAGSNMAHF